MFTQVDYSEALWATSPDFESHPSGRWEPLQIACFAECRLLDEVSLVKAANAPLDAARPWQDLPHQVHDNQAKSRWLYATGTLASNWPDSWLCRARIITSAGYMLRIDCWEAEKALKTTYGSECALTSLAVDEPLEYARLYLEGNLQMWVDAEDSLELY